MNKEKNEDNKIENENEIPKFQETEFDILIDESEQGEKELRKKCQELKKLVANRIKEIFNRIIIFIFSSSSIFSNYNRNSFVNKGTFNFIKIII